MIISIINHSTLPDEEVLFAIRAINRQMREDFEPYWSLGALVRLEGKGHDRPEIEFPADMRGDAVIYLWDEVNVENALGYHDRNNRGIPFGFVFTELSRSVGENWTVTLSHEVLELVADPEVNLLVAGPHPTEAIDVFHWYEMCDAVQAETYVIDDVEVSNFLLPLYFTGSEELGGRNDFLRRSNGGKFLESFKVNPGGYIGFFNPVTGQHETYSMQGDSVAAKRLEIKSRLKWARRTIRYQRFQKGKSLVEEVKKSRRKGKAA